jgi:HK97 family phage portal protein
VRSLIGSLVGGFRNALPNLNTTAPGLGWARGRSTLPTSSLKAFASNGSLFSIVDLIAGTTSQVGWGLYRPAKSGLKEDRKRVTEHLALNVLNNPNPYATRELFFEASEQHVDLVGECWWAVEKNAVGWPVRLWIARPDTMRPVPAADGGLLGYVHTGPRGEETPFNLDEMIWIKRPDPRDPGPAGRGLGPAQSIMMNIDSAQYSTEWNRNFFINSAEPGGIIEVPLSLGDEEWKRLKSQWGEQHRGVQAAHRVGILEGGAKWVSNSTSQRDMQFVELNQLSREQIREAFRIHKHMLGLSDDVNRANAVTASEDFTSWTVENRLTRFRGALNGKFLPMFGVTGHGTGMPAVEFDYDNPTPPNLEQENADKTTKATAFKTYCDAGADPAWAADVVGLPMPVMSSTPAPAPVSVGGAA